jgi:CubicO group peptidase (beta-lactamase class C family)
MKRFALNPLALTLTASVCLFGQTNNNDSDRPSQRVAQTDNVDSFLRRQMAERHIPGLQIAVARHGSIIFRHVYGIANVQDDIAVTDQTVFPINSITKAFTGVAIMQLVESGRLDLVAPVSRYLDGLPAPWQQVRIRQLLTHESGLPDIMGGERKDGAGWRGRGCMGERANSAYGIPTWRPV